MARKIYSEDYWKVKRKQHDKSELKSLYFDRVKSDIHRKKPRSSWLHNKIYFDIETYERYYDKNNPDELPEIIPYAIGWTTAYKSKFNLDYKVVFGENVANIFINQVIVRDGSSFAGELIAFNIDYDFQVLRHYIVHNFKNQVDIIYGLTEDKKFIWGHLKYKYRNLSLVDLWLWDKSKSVASYLKHISDLVYDDRGNIKEEPLSKELGTIIARFGFTKETLQKRSIDYKKVNLHKADDGNYYYWNSKEDWIEGKLPIQLNKEVELDYLRIDVLSLPIIHSEQVLFRKYIKQTLNIKSPLDHDRSITLPGFAKYLCEEFTRKFLTETVRRKVFVSEYRHECNSYIGAFVGGHKDITYLDEEVFKQMFPGLSFYDDDKLPRIKSYDVNSMYPWAMSTGLPCGAVWDIPPSDVCIEWVEIHFKDWWDENNPDPKRRLYDWKPKYAFLNNSFFGANFASGLIPGVSANNRVYVLRQTLDLFYEMCDAHVEEVTTRYQAIYTELSPFINTLYKIKVNKDGKWPNSTVAMIKLVLNSLYGKMCEKYKEVSLFWSNDLDTLISSNPRFIDELIDLNLLEIDESPKPKQYKVDNPIEESWVDEKALFENDQPILKFADVVNPSDISKQKFKSKIAPYVDLDNECGFFITENLSKRFDLEGRDSRESILAGAYITYLSRWKLLGAVKQEVDNGNVVLYCDTDSIKFIQLNKPTFETHKSKLGAWKYEGSFTHFGHPNKQKKYFMHNKHETDSKKAWMVKTSGIPTRWLREPDKSFDLETIKTLYDANNRVLVVKAKTVAVRNHYWQPVIKDTDFKFVFLDSKDKPTHLLIKGKLYRNG